MNEGSRMKASEAWKNFNLGSELSISGTFIYNGIRRFHEIRKLDSADDIFEVLYNLSVGLERLLKIAVVLLEHSEEGDIEELEKSLITHNHLDLAKRVRKKSSLSLNKPSAEFLSLLARFYKTLRYDRFSLSSVYDPNKEVHELRAFIEKQLNISLEDNRFFGVFNDDRYRKYLRKLVTKLTTPLYEIIKSRAQDLNLYTYELQYGSKAFAVFLGKADIPAENVLWKELLVFFMNAQSDDGAFKFLREIEPLPFDPAMATDYLCCFESDSAKFEVVDELEHHYSELNDTGERLQIMSIIGNPNVCFDSPDDEAEEELFDQGGPK